MYLGLRDRFDTTASYNRNSYIDWRRKNIYIFNDQEDQDGPARANTAYFILYFASSLSFILLGIYSIRALKMTLCIKHKMVQPFLLAGNFIHVHINTGATKKKKIFIIYILFYNVNII